MTDKLVDKYPQNIVDDTATSIKQVVEAKNNSSVSGVVQAQSIINSTINIQVNNSVDKDELSSKNNQNKKLHNSPKQTRFFTGRENELNQVDDLFKSNKEVAISGMGGVGKTQTALEFCHLHIDNYQTILWINAENEVSFNNSYYGVVDLLNLGSDTTSTNEGVSNQGLKVDEVISLVKRWLANNPNWLMVLDNLEDPSLIKDYLPANHQGHVLITTRSQSLKGYAAVVQLKKMSIETGTLFLLKRANLIPIDSNDLEQLKLDNKIDDVLIADAQKIVQAMDGLPLALEQAGAYIQESSCSLADYLKAYQDIRNTASILDNAGEDANDHKSVYATFKLNFDVVKEKSVAAAKLLEVCSFLDSDLIPEEIFTNAGKFLGDELGKLQDNTYEFNNCIKLLLGYSLIERDTNNKSLSIHRLVQTVIRELIGEDNKKLLLDSLAKAFWSLSNDNAEDPKNWTKYQKFLPSVTSLLDFAKLYQSNVPTAKLFHQFGIYCQTQALFTQSLTFCNFATDIYKNHFGNNHLYVANILNNIGSIYKHLSNYKTSLSHFNQALNILKNLFDDNNPNIALTLNNIGTIYYELQNYDKALDYYQQALPKLQNLFGDNNPDVALILNNIGLIHCSKNNYNCAVSYLKQSLHIKKHLFGDTHHDLALTLNNIGEAYRQQESYQKALPFYLEALQMYRNLFGNDHPNVAMVLNNIGLTYKSQNINDEALSHYQQALSIYKNFFESNSHYVALVLTNIGILFEEIGELLKAIEYYKEALEIFDKVFPPNHSYIVKVLSCYSQLLLKLKKNSEAQPLLNRLNALGKPTQQLNQRPSINNSTFNISFASPLKPKT